MRITKSKFVKLVAARTGRSESDIKDVADVMFDEIVCRAMQGDEILITNFGTFSCKRHKGHPVRFNSTRVDDYTVFIFHPAMSLRKKIRYCPIEESR